jgi:DNA-binding transcriptional ArsR family regulator
MVESRFVKVMPPVLTPFVRSDTVGAILAETFTNPDGELTIAEVARRGGVPSAVAHKEITRLVKTGVLTDRREGNNRLVRVNQRHVLYAPMAQIIAATYGPVPVLRTLLQGVPGVSGAFFYGSWAARRAGEPGAFPRDVDVMVIGELALDDMIGMQAAAREQLRTEVNIHRITAQAWAHPDGSPFLRTVVARPVTWLIGGDDANE